MRLLRPACLALLSAVVGLGVPAVFSQQGKSSKSPSKSSSPKKSLAKAAPKTRATAKRPAVKSSSSRNSASATQQRSSSTGKKSLGKSKSSASKASSSRRLRRQPGQKAPTSDRITEIQSALARDGSFAGEPTGMWDDSTSSAMRKFQTSHGLNPTGKLDAPTLQRLGLGSTTAGVAAPTPPPGAVSRLSSSVLAPSATEDAPRR